MQIEFETMSGLLEEGYHKMVYHHFGVSEEFARRVPIITDYLTRYGEKLLTALQINGDESQLHECYLRIEAFRLIDEYVRPQTVNQVAYCSYVASTIISTLFSMLQTHAAFIREERARQLQNHPIYGSYTATA